MKTVMMAVLTLLLGGCQATVVSYQSGSGKTNCPPVVSVQSVATSVIVTDGSECKAVKK